MFPFVYKLQYLLFPRKCVLCCAILPQEHIDLCPKCRREAPEFTFTPKRIGGAAGWTAVWFYKDLVRPSILRYKFRSYRQYAQTYGRLIAMRVLNDLDAEFDLVTWVTPSIRRQLIRGFDHGRKLAKFVSKELNLPLKRTLTKKFHNAPQSASASASQRRGNVLDVYKVYKPEVFRSKRILLIDDIITTGATASECAKTLMIGGAASVHVAAVAATDFRKKRQNPGAAAPAQRLG